VIRETIRSMTRWPYGRVVLTNAKHIIALAARQGLMGTLLALTPTKCAARRNISTIFQDVKNHQGHAGSRQAYRRAKIRIVRGPTLSRTAYESALIDLINQKRNGDADRGEISTENRRLKRHQIDDAFKASSPRELAQGTRPSARKPRTAHRRPARDAAAAISGKAAAAKEGSKFSSMRRRKPINSWCARRPGRKRRD